MLTRFRINLLAILFFASLLSSCGESSPPHNQSIGTELPVTLEAHFVTSQSVPRFFSATGYTSVSRSIEISTSQSGTIYELVVKEGDLVEQGALLLVLDETELMSSIKSAESAIESAEIRLKDFAQDLDDARQLGEKRVITVEQLRKAEVRHNLARTELQQAQSELKRQLARKPYHRIHSPINARVIKRWVDQGDLAVIGKPLLLLEAIGGLEFETSLPAEWLNTLQIGDRYLVNIHHREAPVEAVISHIVNSVDRTTQTIQVKLALPDEEHIEAGLSGQVEFIVANEEHLLIESSALVKRAGVFGVFRIDRDRAVFTPVNVGRKWKQYQVVLSGLNASEVLVTHPPKSLRDGSLVDSKVAGIVEAEQ